MAGPVLPGGSRVLLSELAGVLLPACRAQSQRVEGSSLLFTSWLQPRAVGAAEGHPACPSRGLLRCLLAVSSQPLLVRVSVSLSWGLP